MTLSASTRERARRGARLPRTARLGVLVALGLLGWVGSLKAQPESMIRLITLTSVTAAKEDGKWVITAQGAAPKLPAGAKVDFQVTWRSQVLQSFRETLESPAAFTVSLKPKAGFASTDGLLLQTVVYLKDATSGQSVQPKKVLDAIKADPESFPPNRAPWTDYNFDLTFQLTTPEDMQAELEQTRKFFEDRYVALAKLDRVVADQVKAVQAGSEFVTKDKFDAKKWRKWFDDDVVKPIVDLQKEIEKAHENPQYIPYRTALFLLQELSGAIGKRVLTAQADLYKEKNVELSAAEGEPEGLSTAIRRKKVTKRYLADLVSDIQKALGLTDGESGDSGAGQEEEQ